MRGRSRLPHFFSCKLYCTSYQVHQVMNLHLNAQVEMVIILQWNAFWWWNRNQGNTGGCENVFFPSPQTAQGKALSSCILCSLFNSLPSLLTLNPLFLWLCVLTSLLFLLHLSTLWGSCVIKIYDGHSQWQNTAMVKPAIVLIFPLYISENITQLRDMASMKVTYFP